MTYQSQRRIFIYKILKRLYIFKLLRFLFVVFLFGFSRRTETAEQWSASYQGASCLTGKNLLLGDFIKLVTHLLRQRSKHMLRIEERNFLFYIYAE